MKTVAEVQTAIADVQALLEKLEDRLASAQKKWERAIAEAAQPAKVEKVESEMASVKAELRRAQARLEHLEGPVLKAARDDERKQTLAGIKKDYEQHVTAAREVEDKIQALLAEIQPLLPGYGRNLWDAHVLGNRASDFGGDLPTPTVPPDIVEAALEVAQTLKGFQQLQSSSFLSRTSGPRLRRQGPGWDYAKQIYGN